MPKPVVEHEVEYESVLVAFEDGAVLAGGGGHRGASSRRAGAAGIHVLVMITVPAELADRRRRCPSRRRAPQSLIDSARVRGGRRVTGHWEKVRPGQAGRRIVEEAREINARARS